MVKFFVTVLFSFSLLAVRPVLAAEAVARGKKTLDKIIKINTETGLYKNESKSIQDLSVSIRWRLVSDTRCPEDRRCVREGEAIVKFIFTNTANPSTAPVVVILKFQPGQPGPTSEVNLDDNKKLLLELRDVFPHPGHLRGKNKQVPKVMVKIALLL